MADYKIEFKKEVLEAGLQLYLESLDGDVETKEEALNHLLTSDENGILWQIINQKFVRLQQVSNTDRTWEEKLEFIKEESERQKAKEEAAKADAEAKAEEAKEEEIVEQVDDVPSEEE